MNWSGIGDADLITNDLASSVKPYLSKALLIPLISVAMLDELGSTLIQPHSSLHIPTFLSKKVL